MEPVEGTPWAVLRAGVALILLLVTGCAGAVAGVRDDPGGSVDRAERGGAVVAPATSRAVVEITPRDGTEGVAPRGALRVVAERGRLTEVRVRPVGGGEPVRGTFADRGHSWTPRGRLALATAYAVHAVAVDGGGRETGRDATFTTLVPRDRFTGYYTPEDGSTVGVGMVVSLRFDRPIVHRGAVQRAVQVIAEPAVEVAPHWFGDRRLDFRPAAYWRPGTRVTLRLRLRDVAGAPGVYGTQSKDVTFHVGRSQVSVVDAGRKTMRVVRDGRLLRTVPVTAGAPDTATYNGKMVITEQFEVTRMNGDTVGFGGEYDIKDVPHAMRLTASGTFIHGNYWAPDGTFGRENTSHGCIGLPDVKRSARGRERTPAAWFFHHSLVGDVVEVVGSPDTTVAADNGLGGWNMDWASWRAGSVLP